MMLGDLGAEVIKVEPPNGDTARRLGPPFLKGESTLFMSLNRNKKSVTVDLKTAAGRARATQLIDGADILIESFRPGVADRLGIGFGKASARNPKLLYCSISAYGQRGPWSDRPGVDGALQAISGLMSINGHQDAPPAKIQAPIVDMVTGYQAAVSIMAALWKHRESKSAIHLDISLFSSALALQQIPFSSYLMTGDLPRKSGSGAPYASPNEAYATLDGYILLAAYQDTHWNRLCDAIDRPQLCTDPRFATLTKRMENRPALSVELETVFGTRSTLVWADLLSAHGLICTPVAEYDEVATSPQIAAAGLLSNMEHPTLGPITMFGGSLGGCALPVTYAPPLLAPIDDDQGWDT